MSTTMRYWEYYNMQETFDKLFEESQENSPFHGLYELITSENNILLAYRTIKSNKGSKTAGVDSYTIDDFKRMDKDAFLSLVRQNLSKYKPNAVKRVLIPKPNGDQRPLGIPTMFDRLIQQMIKQILEPICEAKFYEHSYGFRPMRGTRHAISRVMFLISRNSFHYAVDIDIKGFFDNVNHTLLLKQLWNIGVKDKRVLKIIYLLLKAPIKGIGIPTKGVPQGGVLSPVLSNLVLNDLDQWIAKQWHYFETAKTYANDANQKRAMKTTKLKEGFIVRYADDFKILAKDFRSAQKWFFATKSYLKERLKLEISPEKSKIINLRKNKSEFLGYSLYVVPKKKKWVCNSRISNKKKKHIKTEVKKRIKAIQRNPTRKNVQLYNAYVLGLRNYFRYATHVNIDMKELAFNLSLVIFNRLKSIGKYEIPTKAPPVYKKFFKNNYRTFKVCGIYLFPLADIQTATIWNYTQSQTPYTLKGRNIAQHKELDRGVLVELSRLLTANIPNRSLEYGDNRLSRYSMTKGNCEVLKEFIIASEVHCHHYIPRALGGTDKYENLRIIHKDIHRLIHATDNQTIENYLKQYLLTVEQVKRINQYRNACNLNEIKH
ncbi:group II intron reverse transcriptase/maturase [Halobacillus karajensis]|uniref:Group II intron-encoded protein LtrA n=1 Tax=Halobacillus karajensis TaxID=195088 RepID=A0A059NXW3_9BACI|nr:group II intron reverse transcriptase/maturase [Halobacillus karajensis]CDQ20314.1 Group II intron-encoded protein LtrA [Halobacillus karajensis]CDQ23618.1 Group II intron-encoded protein LtrA [Halobacillus karajensis]CDQ27097.1 Group II intron-encoded protein LtrA [Halobacillus karajensis]